MQSAARLFGSSISASNLISVSGVFIFYSTSVIMFSILVRKEFIWFAVTVTFTHNLSSIFLKPIIEQKDYSTQPNLRFC